MLEDNITNVAPRRATARCSRSSAMGLEPKATTYGNYFPRDVRGARTEVYNHFGVLLWLPYARQGRRRFRGQFNVTERAGPVGVHEARRNSVHANFWCESSRKLSSKCCQACLGRSIGGAARTTSESRSRHSVDNRPSGLAQRGRNRLCDPKGTEEIDPNDLLPEIVCQGVQVRRRNWCSRQWSTGVVDQIVEAAEKLHRALRNLASGL